MNSRDRQSQRGFARGIYKKNARLVGLPWSHTFTKISLVTLDGDIVDSENAVNFEMGMHLNYTVHKPNIYTIWYMKYHSIFCKIGMRK